MTAGLAFDLGRERTAATASPLLYDFQTFRRRRLFFFVRSRRPVIAATPRTLPLLYDFRTARPSIIRTPSYELYRRLDAGWWQLKRVAFENDLPFVDHLLQLSRHLEGIVAVDASE